MAHHVEELGLQPVALLGLFLGRDQLALGPLAVGDVHDRAGHQERLAGVVPRRLTAGLEPAIGAGPGAQPVLDVEGLALLEVGVDRGPGGVRVVRMEVAGE